MSNRKSTLKEDVAVLFEKVEEIATNHIPHLQKQIDDFRNFYFSNHKELSDKVDKQNEKIDTNGRKLAYLIGGLAVLQIVIQLLLNHAIQ